MAIPKKTNKSIPKEQTDMMVPLHWSNAHEKEFVFANQIFARYSGGAYWITFGQAHGPYELELDVKQLQETGVYANPVAKIVFTPETMEAVLKQLNGLYDRFKKSK